MMKQEPHISKLPQRSAQLVTIGPEDPASTAARKMWENDICSVVVADERRKVVGIVTERDILNRVGGASADPSEIRVKDVMTSGVACCPPGTPIGKTLDIMSKRGFRHILIVENGVAVGMMSSQELMPGRCHTQSNFSPTKK